MFDKANNWLQGKKAQTSVKVKFIPSESKLFQNVKMEK